MNALERVRKKYGNLPRATDITDKSPSVSSVSPSPEESEKFSNLLADLEPRIRAMAHRWDYTPKELRNVLERARANPAVWLSAVAYDEEREAEFRALGLLRCVIS